MIFVTGPAYSGKKEAACRILGCSRDELPRRAATDVHERVSGRETPEELEALADSLCALELVTAAELGGGVVPAEPVARAKREAAGRLACLLAQRAERVYRVFCGLTLQLKPAGEEHP